MNHSPCASTKWPESPAHERITFPSGLLTMPSRPIPPINMKVTSGVFISPWNLPTDPSSTTVDSPMETSTRSKAVMVIKRSKEIPRSPTHPTGHPSTRPPTVPRPNNGGGTTCTCRLTTPCARSIACLETSTSALATTTISTTNPRRTNGTSCPGTSI